jgi:hypothetical protein
MKRIYPLLLCLLWVFGPKLYAQHCGSDFANAKLANKNPAFQSFLDKSYQDWLDFKNIPINPQHLVVYENNDTIYEIPVVFHVMNSGEPVGNINNPSDQVIINYLNYVNQTFAATWSHYVGVQNGGVKFPIRFKMAARSPGCNPVPHNGINRVNVAATYPIYSTRGVALETTNGVPERDLKELSVWDRDQYYNIWLVNYIDGPSGGVGGYAYYPGVNPELDGTVLLVQYTTPYANGSYYNAFPHEIGHSFGLRHTFEGSSGPTVCPPTTNCASTGDLVCDTEPHALESGCPTFNGCTNSNFVNTQYNIMNYTNCANRFSVGQKERFLFHLFNYRSTLIHSLGATPLTQQPVSSPIAACVPPVRLTNNGANCGPIGVELANLVSTTNMVDLDGYANYRDYSCILEPAKIIKGNTYPIEVATAYNIQHVKVWIDFNNNGVLGDVANELVLSSTATTSSYIHTANISIPQNAVTCTPLRMRVTSDFYGQNINTLTPCAQLAYGQHEDYAVIVQPPVVVPTAYITSNVGNTICANQTVVLTATTTNTQATSQYLWYKNGVYVGSGTTHTASGIANNDVYTFKVTYPGSCTTFDTLTTSGITFQVTTSAVPSVTIAAIGNNGCSGQLISFNATPVNQGSTPTYIWKVNGVAIPGNNSVNFTSTTLNNGDIVTCEMTSSLSCVSQQTVSSNAVTVAITNTVVPTISITASQTNLCTPATVTFTANITNGGTAPIYQWYVNSQPISGNNSPTFVIATLTGGDEVYCELISNVVCAASSNVNSNIIHMTNVGNIIPTITISSSNANNVFCDGESAIFTAITNNGGANPSYQWKVNNVNVTGATSSTFTTATLNNGDVLSCELISNANCLATNTALSNDITVTVNNSVNAGIIISTPSNSICLGDNVTFTANITNGGSNPAYQWTINNVNVLGANANTFTTNTLSDGDVLNCILTSNAYCVANANTTSNAISMNVLSNVVPTVTIVSSLGDSVCQNIPVTITANITHGGNNPTYEWRLNNNIINTTSNSITLNNLNTADELILQITSNANCLSTPYAVSNRIVFYVTTADSLYILPEEDVVTYCSLNDVNLEVFGATGDIQWYRNDTLMPNRIFSRVNAVLPGEYVASSTINNCEFKSSQSVNVTLLPVPQPILDLNNENWFVLDTIYEQYTWYFNGVKISKIDSSSHKPHAYGVFKVCATIKDCNVCSENFHYADPLGIYDNVDEMLDVYPNPTNGIVYIKYSEVVDVIVKTIDGRTLKTVKQTNAVDITDLAEGVYLFYINDKNNNLLQINKILKSIN